jgi:hypothetical protein
MNSYLKDIQSVETSLLTFPLSGKSCPTSKRPTLRHSVSPKFGYSIFYEVDDTNNPQLIIIISSGKAIPIP